MDNMLELYGSTCTIRPYDGEAFNVKAFVNPTESTRYNFGAPVYAESGGADRRSYVYVGRADVDLSLLPKGSTIVYEGKAYYVIKSEIYWLHDDAIYCRAVLQLHKGGLTDD